MAPTIFFKFSAYIFLRISSRTHHETTIALTFLTHIIYGIDGVWYNIQTNSFVFLTTKNENISGFGLLSIYVTPRYWTLIEYKTSILVHPLNYVS